jgi:hypothetical protein
MGTDNDDQNQNEKVERNGLGSDDKAKGAVFSDDQTVEPVTSKVERGGTAVDDRAKSFELYENPKA